jgi:uncharacterized protein YbjQ (UPF0145 family)
MPSLNEHTLDEFAATLSAIRDEAIARMVERAAALGANAVVRMRFDSAPVGHEMTEIVAYGTAVVIDMRERVHGTTGNPESL